MHIQEMESCCSIIELCDLYDDEMTQSEFISEIARFIFENYGNYYSGLDLNEIGTCIIAATNNKTQKPMAKLLKTNKFKEIPFYGRHQKTNIQIFGKKDKYVTFWIKTNLPAGVIPKLRTMLKRKKHDHW